VPASEGLTDGASPSGPAGSSSAQTVSGLHKLVPPRRDHHATDPMNDVRNLISELREKRLWPVAAALIVALIAVPLLLSSSSKPVAVAQVPAAIGSARPRPRCPRSA
jgi:hypothetical protein